MRASRHRLFSLVLALFPLLAEPRCVVAADPCIDLERSQAFSFEGKLTHKVFPGPPNYESVRKGDKPEPSYILQLQKQTCVSGSDEQIDRIQIFPEDADNKVLWAKLRSLIGNQVVVAGKSAFLHETGHHHAPLLLEITEIRRVPTGQR
jgi:hypothetical protein